MIYNLRSRDWWAELALAVAFCLFVAVLLLGTDSRL
jgi:hypothetical protein